MRSQLDLFLPPVAERGATLGDGEPVPPGPYRVGMLFCFTLGRYVPPYTVVAGDGRTIAGHIDNPAAAAAIAAALNARPPE